MRRAHSYDVLARPRPAARSRGRSRLAFGLAAGALVLTSCGGDDGGGGGGGAAEGYPDGEITIVVPFSAGGPTDTVTRLIAEPMSEELGQQIGGDPRRDRSPPRTR